MEEKWAMIPGYGDNYEASDWGRIRNVTTGRILAQAPQNKGYMQVSLFVDRKHKRCTVHRLVAAAFLGPDPRFVNHKDLNRANPRLGNLEYLTRRENIEHAQANGVKFGPKRAHKFLSEDTVRAIRVAQGSGPQVARRFGVGTSTVYNIRKGVYHKDVAQEAPCRT
jgi:hypothetical protein